MLSKIPFSMENLSQEDIDREILRIGLIAELDAINLYEQLASLTKDEKIKAIFLDIAREEKTHVGEFLTLLLMNDEEQEDELEEGKEEVEELIEEEEEEE
jgi:rubrerythrin